MMDFETVQIRHERDKAYSAWEKASHVPIAWRNDRRKWSLKRELDALWEKYKELDDRLKEIIRGERG